MVEVAAGVVVRAYVVEILVEVVVKSMVVEDEVEVAWKLHGTEVPDDLVVLFVNEHAVILFTEKKWR